ncbi:uncharacterized protein LOC144733385 isoform X2 [Lampetra planeri]
MESFFQAAACALDKVLDDFEQTEDDVDYFGLVPAARGSEMFSSQDGTRRAGLAAPEPLPPPPRPPPVGTDALSEKRSSLPALISPPLAPLVDGQGGERDRPFLSLPSNFIAEKPGSPPSQSFSSSASSVESPLPSPSFPVHPPAAAPGSPASPPENLPSTSPPSRVASPWASLPTDDARGTAPIDPFATTRRSDLADALDVGLVSPAVTSSDETVTPSPPRSSQQPQFTRHFEAARLQDCLAAGGGEDESAARNACRPPLVTFDLLSAGPGAETLAPQRGPPLCDLLSGTHDNEQRPRNDEQRPRDAIAADTSLASDVDRTPFRGGRAEGGETNGDGSCSTSVGGERLAVVCVADEPRSPDRDLSDETWRNSGSAAEMSSENDASAMFEAESVRADASRDDSPEPPLSVEALAATGVEMFAEGGEFDDADRSCGEGENSGGGVAIDQPTALDDCRRGVDSEASEPPSEPPAGDSLRHWPPIPGDGADVVRPPLYRGAEREALPSLVNEEEVAMPTLGTEEPKKAREEFLEELEEREEEPGASVTVKEEEEGTAPRTNGAADVSESDAELEAFLSSLEASADSPPASPAPSLKEDRVTEEKEVEDSKSDTSGDSVSPLRGGGADSGSPAMAPLLPRHAAPAHNGTDTPGAARPPPGGARPKQPLRLQLPRPASNLLGSREEADGREPPEAHASPSSATENHVTAMAPAEEGEDDEDEETTQEEEEEEERAWSHGPGGASRARAGGERPAGGTQGREGPGMSAPMWVPDAEAPNCMRCTTRFTFTRRRHHCRACGKVFCAPCCSQKSRLRYMENKEARVCIRCHTHIDKAEAVDRMVALAPSPPPAPPSPTSMSAPPSGSPNPNNPAEYCSTLPPLQQARAAGTLASPPPTVMVPVSALKHPGQDGSQREPRRVWFADGILPNGEVADAAILSGTPGTPVPGSSPPPTPPPAAAAAAAQDPGLPVSLSEPEPLPPTAAPAVPVTAVVPMVPAALAASLGPPAAPGGGHRVLPAPTGSPVGKGLNLIPDDDEGLPPILISSGVKGDYSVEERPSPGLLVAVLEEAETRGGGGADVAPVVFVLNANLLVSLRIINYVNRRCWVFATRGMHAVGQAEVVVLLQCLPDEKTVPKDVFHSLLHVYTDAYKGKPVGHLGHSFLGRGFLGSREHGGFLFVSPAMQALPACELPPQPLLFALLIQKWEAPWAKVFPIRLMLRLGAEFRFYPCPLFSVRFRKPLFGETGHTIMNLLADFRNYQYSLPTVPGLVVSMEMGHTWIDIPSNRYNQMVKVLNGANEHVLAFGAVFNSAADSHLVCVQNDDGNYQTQAINIHATPRKVTGASFVVFNGALKSSSGFLAKSSIVEDGLMVQITAEGMEALRSALREMRDHTLVCGRADGEPPREHVHARWVADDAAFNRGVTSPIDGRSMEGVPSVKIFQGSEFKGSGKIIRWTEVFFLQKEEEGVGEGGSREGGTSTFDPADHSRVAEAVARAFCVALAPRLKELREDGLTQLGLRLTLHSEQVGYQAGGNGQPLPVQYMNELDCALIPIMHGGGGGGGPGDGAVRMELVFSIMENVS